MNGSGRLDALHDDGTELGVQGDAMRARRFAAVVGIAAAALWAPIASAAPPPVTTITIEAIFGGAETFTATGGVVCSSGTAVSDPAFISGGGAQGRGVLTFHVVKTLTCENGDTFKLLVDAAGSPNSGGTVGGFAAGHGTGSLTGLRGGGKLVGTAYPDGSGITDVYTGRLRIAP
jgi:hypothetical protein